LLIGERGHSTSFRKTRGKPVMDKQSDVSRFFRGRVNEARDSVFQYPVCTTILENAAAPVYNRDRTYAFDSKGAYSTPSATRSASLCPFGPICPYPRHHRVRNRLPFADPFYTSSRSARTSIFPHFERLRWRFKPPSNQRWYPAVFPIRKPVPPNGGKAPSLAPSYLQGGTRNPGPIRPSALRLPAATSPLCSTAGGSANVFSYHIEYISDSICVKPKIQRIVARRA
jgi:hypothetical protein